VELNDRELSWDGCVNVRDLGGLGQVRPGAVVRMEQPRRLTEAGWAAAWAYGVRTVVDLRDPDEREPDLRNRSSSGQIACYRSGSADAARSRATAPTTTRADPAAILGLRRCTARGTRRT
jgi:hypothetical protein